MTFSLYNASIPVFIRMLTNLSAVIKKAEQDADARGIDHQVFLTARHAPDMLPLTNQIYIATDLAKTASFKLSGQTPPTYEDNESTFDQLQARITKTLDHLSAFNEAAFDDAATRQIALKIGDHALEFTGEVYLLHFIMPNFYFHLTTTYTILRHNGVELGKMDYMGGLPG